MSDQVPAWMANLQALRRSEVLFCNNVGAIFIETAKAPAGDFIIDLLSFGLGDILRGAVKPRNLRSGRHIAKGRVARAVAGLLPEFGNLLGKFLTSVIALLTGGKRLKADQITDGARGIWRIDETVQFGLFNWMLGDLLSRFVVDWISAVQDAADARNCDLAHLILGGGASGVLAIQGWQGMIIAGTVDSQNGINWNAGGGNAGPRSFNYHLGLVVKNKTSNPTIYEVRILKNIGAPTQIAGERRIDLIPPFGTANAIVVGHIEAGATFGVEHRISRGAVTIPQALVMLKGSVFDPP